jgi:hypothetical protein
VSYFDLLTPNFAIKLLRYHGNGSDGVAVTADGNNSSDTKAGSARAATRSRVQSFVQSPLAGASTRCLLAATLIVAAAGVALAQNVQPPPSATTPSTVQPAPAQPPVPPSAGVTLPPQPPPTAALPAPAPEKHGFFDDLARWWHDSTADFNAKLKEQQSKLDDFNKKSADAAKDAAAATQQAMKNAADAVARLPTAKVIEIQAPCAIAGNGSADCASAAANACKGKGFVDGQPLDVRTAEKCTASLWLQGRKQPADCAVETVVLRAACQ